MNLDQQDNEKLTNELGVWLDTQKIPEQPVAPSSPMMMKLSPQTARNMERYYAQQVRKKKSLRERKRYTRKPGHVHPKKKEATARRKRERLWREAPYWCVSYGYGNWRIDKNQWDEWIAPLWQQHSPKELKLVPYRGYGTKEKPHTAFTFNIVNAKSGAVLYDGNSQYLYCLSQPSSLE